ncbi:MAG: TOMM precursor leader peptide-binding protein [Actinomycetales bacterium]
MPVRDADPPVGLRPGVTFSTLADGRRALHAEGLMLNLPDQAASLALPLLAGHLSPTQIAQRLDGLVGGAEAAALIADLWQRGLLVQGVPQPPGRVFVDDSALPSPPAPARARYKEQVGNSQEAVKRSGRTVLDGVPLEGSAGTGETEQAGESGGEPAAWVARLIADCGLHPSGPAEADAAIVLCADYLQTALIEAAERLRSQATAWLPVRVSATAVWLGPWVEENLCWDCVRARLRAHDPRPDSVVDASAENGHHVGTHDQRTSLDHGGAWQLTDQAGDERTVDLRHVDEQGGHDLASPDLTLVGMGAAARLTRDRLTRDRLAQHTTTASGRAAPPAGDLDPGQRPEPGRGRLLCIDADTMSQSEHVVLARPECPRCGTGEAMAARMDTRPALAPQETAERGATGHRARNAEDTWRRYRHLVSPVSGPVARVDPDRRLPPGLHAYLAGSNLAGGLVPGRRSVLRWDCGGKGATAAAARTSALCEALERTSSSWHGDERRILARYADLEEAIPARDLQLFGDEQFAGRTGWNSRHSAFQRVPEPVSDDDELEWTPAWPLDGGPRTLIPTGLCLLGGPDAHRLAGDSNGCAAGSTLTDAVLQGLLEVIERDAVGIWWYNRLPQPDIDLDGLREPYLDDVRQVYHDLGRDLWALEVTSDLGIPVVAAVSRLRDAARESIIFGFGAHLDPRVAVLRAVLEMNQFLATALTVDPEQWWDQDPDFARWMTTATLDAHPYLAPHPQVPRVPDQIPEPRQLGLLPAVDAVRDRLEIAGLRAYLVDLTRADLGLPVVKVLVPGARHCWLRTAPGRLFEVPVRLGRLKHQHGVADLNPDPIFL